MRVCMVVYSFYESDNRVRRYAETLVRQGVAVDVVALGQAGQASVGLVEGVHVYRVQGRERDERGVASYLRKILMFLLRAAWLLTRRHLRNPYSFVHVHSMPDFLVFAALTPWLTGAKIILDIHDVLPELYAYKFGIDDQSAMFRLLLWEERLSIWFSHHTVIANHIWHERVAKRAGCAHKISTILNYTDTTIFYKRPRTVSGGDEFVLCYPGTLNSHQGVDIVIEAMALLRDDVPNLRFMVIGAGQDEDALRSKAAELGIADRVTMLGRIPIDKVAEIMATTDLGVEPKCNNSFAGDAFSTKIPEFMAMDLPVVASDTRAHEYYFSGGIVEFFKSGDSADLAAKILELVRSPARREVLRQGGRRFISENEWSVKESEYLDLVASLVGKGKLESNNRSAGGDDDMESTSP